MFGAGAPLMGAGGGFDPRLAMKMGGGPMGGPAFQQYQDMSGQTGPPGGGPMGNQMAQGGNPFGRGSSMQPGMGGIVGGQAGGPGGQMGAMGPGGGDLGMTTQYGMPPGAGGWGGQRNGMSSGPARPEMFALQNMDPSVGGMRQATGQPGFSGGNMGPGGGQLNTPLRGGQSPGQLNFGIQANQDAGNGMQPGMNHTGGAPPPGGPPQAPPGGFMAANAAKAGLPGQDRFSLLAMQGKMTPEQANHRREMFNQGKLPWQQQGGQQAQSAPAGAAVRPPAPGGGPAPPAGGPASGGIYAGGNTRGANPFGRGGSMGQGGRSGGIVDTPAGGPGGSAGESAPGGGAEPNKRPGSRPPRQPAIQVNPGSVSKPAIGVGKPAATGAVTDKPTPIMAGEETKGSPTSTMKKKPSVAAGFASRLAK